MRYTRITDCDFNNGEGIRVTLWVSGCRHHCPGCQNEWMQRYDIGRPLLECWDMIERYSEPGYISGLTLSGGDPLDQDSLSELKELILKYRKTFPEKTIWLYTGFYYDRLSVEQKVVADMCDVVVDGPFIESQKDLTLPFRGSANQHIIHIKEQ